MEELVGIGVQLVIIKKEENFICSFDDLTNPGTL